MTMATPETKQVGSADSTEVLSYKQDYYGKPPENPLQCSGTPSLTGAGFPPQMSIRGQDGGWEMMQTCAFVCHLPCSQKVTGVSTP